MTRFLAISALTLMGSGALMAQEELPAGKGKEATERICSGCHGLDYLTGQQLSKSQWESVVDQMAGRGASGSDAEFAEVSSYLAEHFGRKVNVNKASANELQVGGFSKTEAEAIVKARAAKPLKDLADLKAIPGVDAARVESMRANLTW